MAALEATAEHADPTRSREGSTCDVHRAGTVGAFDPVEVARWFYVHNLLGECVDGGWFAAKRARG